MSDQRNIPQKIRCKNCNLIYKGNFCPRCGQNATVKRFDFKYFLKESFLSSLDIENGFFPTIKSLTLTPGKSRSEEHTSELQSPMYLVCRLLLEKKKKTNNSELV